LTSMSPLYALSQDGLDHRWGVMPCERPPGSVPLPAVSSARAAPSMIWGPALSGGQCAVWHTRVGRVTCSTLISLADASKISLEARGSRDHTRVCESPR